MNIVQKIAFASLVSGSFVLPFSASPVHANPYGHEVTHEVTYEVHPSYLPSYIRTSEYCETYGTRLSGVWTRRGSSPIYDAVWTGDRGERVYGTVEVVENHDGNLTFHYQAGNYNGYYQVRYDNRDTYSGTWRGDNGLWGRVTAYVQL